MYSASRANQEATERNILPAGFQLKLTERDSNPLMDQRAPTHGWMCPTTLAISGTSLAPKQNHPIFRGFR